MGLLKTAAKLLTATSKTKGLRSTYRPRLGPFVFNTSTRTGLSSVSLDAGPLRYKVWDRRGNKGVSSVDLPGPISYRPTGR